MRLFFAGRCPRTSTSTSAASVSVSCSSCVAASTVRPNFGVVGGRYPIYREKSIFICMRPVCACPLLLLAFAAAASGGVWGALVGRWGGGRMKHLV